MFQKTVQFVMFAAMAMVPAAQATTFTLDVNGCSSGCGSGPYGTVTVVQGVDANTVNVTETLTAGEVFANTGAGDALGYNLNKSATIVAGSLTSGFSAGGSDGFSTFGTFGYTIVCSSCGSGTSSPQYSGPLSFSLYSATGLTPDNFIKNSDGYYFASDIGVPNGRIFSTGNVASDTATTTTTPEPGSWVMLLSGCAFAGLGLRKRFAAAPGKA